MKKASRTSSRKAKGRRLQQEVRDLLREKYKDILEPLDIMSTIMGDKGVDIKLSPAARKVIPFNIECKNQETMTMWQWLLQSEANGEPGRIPLLVFTRNRSDTYISMKLSDLLELV